MDPAVPELFQAGLLFDAKRALSEGLPPYYPEWGRFAHAISWAYVVEKA